MVSQKWRIGNVVCTSITSRVKAGALSRISKRSAFFSSSRGSLNGSLNGSSSRKAGKEEAEEKSLTRVVFPAGRKRRHF